jgi:hypothetical protein
VRGQFRDQSGLFSYVDPEDRIPAGHPLRKVRALVREVLKDLSRSSGGWLTAIGQSIRVFRFAAPRRVVAQLSLLKKPSGDGIGLPMKAMVDDCGLSNRALVLL